MHEQRSVRRDRLWRRHRRDLRADERRPLGNDAGLIDAIRQPALAEPARDDDCRSAPASSSSDRSSRRAHATNTVPIWPPTTRNRSSRVSSRGISLSRGTARIVWPSPLALEQIENPRRAPRVELGERIVEQKQRRASGALRERRRLEHPQRDRRRSLLARPTRTSRRSRPSSVMSRSSRCGPTCVSPRARSRGRFASSAPASAATRDRRSARRCSRS